MNIVDHHHRHFTSQNLISQDMQRRPEWSSASHLSRVKTKELGFLALKELLPRGIERTAPIFIHMDAALPSQMFDKRAAIEEEERRETPKLAKVFEEDDSEDASMVAELLERQLDQVEEMELLSRTPSLRE